jgi:urease accessory protein
VTRVHQDGLLALRLRCDSRRRTVLAERRQRFPLRMTVPMYLDEQDRGMAFVYVQNPTGAVFADDRLETTVIAEVGARVHVTTQSATKLSAMDAGRATQELRFVAAPGALLEYVPDPLIPQGGADYEQRTLIEVAPGGTFVAAEIIGPGRRAHGERFAYRRLRLTSEVRREGRQLAVETLELVPGRRRPDRHGLLGGRDYLATMLVAAPEHDSDRLAARLDALVAAAPDALAAAGVLPNDAGVTVRILTDGPAAARALLRRAWALARQELVGLPLPRVRK